MFHFNSAPQTCIMLVSSNKTPTPAGSRHLQFFVLSIREGCTGGHDLEMNASVA